MWLQNTVRVAKLLRNNFTDSLRRYPNPQKSWGWVLPGLVVRRPGFEAMTEVERIAESILARNQ